MTKTILLDCDDDFRSGCRNVCQCHQQQSFSELLSPGRSNHRNDWNFCMGSNHFKFITPLGKSFHICASPYIFHNICLAIINMLFRFLCNVWLLSLLNVDLQANATCPVWCTFQRDHYANFYVLIINNLRENWKILKWASVIGLLSPNHLQVCFHNTYYCGLWYHAYKNTSITVQMKGLKNSPRNNRKS